MASCQGCGKRANLAYNRYLRFFPYNRRVYCDDCFSKLQRREDLIFIGVLFSMVFLFIGMIMTIHYVSNKQIIEKQSEIQAILDEKDLNKDGRVDLWEDSATQEMRSNFKQFAYPWRKVIGQNATTNGARLKYLVHRQDILEFSQDDKFFTHFNFPDLLRKLLPRITDPQSTLQLYRVFVSMDDDIVFFIHRYPAIPKNGFNEEFFAILETKGDQDTKGKKNTAEKTDAAKSNKMEPIEVVICFERLSESKINDLFKLSLDEYHIENFALVKGPKPEEKKKDKKKKK